MNNKFTTVASTYSAILGGVMAISAVLELYLSTNMGMKGYSILGVEYILAVALHYYILHRAVKEYGTYFSKEEGFSFGKGYGFAITVSAFSGVIVGLATFIYYKVVGYDNFVAQTISQIKDAMARSEVPASLMSSLQTTMTQTFEQLQNSPQPTIISTIMGCIVNAVVFALIFGAIIAGVNSRKAQIFGDSDDQVAEQ